MIDQQNGDWMEAKTKTVAAGVRAPNRGWVKKKDGKTCIE
jgi:hypothetical protein